MASFVPVVCPTCGGKLEATADPGRYVCPSCGNEYLLEEGGSLQSTAEANRAAEAERQARAQRAAEAQARIAAEAKAAWEQKQTAARQERPLSFWLQDHSTLVMAFVVGAGLILMGLVYVLILLR